MNLLRKLFRHCVLVTSTGKHISGQGDDTFCTKMKKDDQMYVGKKLKHWPQVLALPCHPGVDRVLLFALLLLLLVLLLLLHHLVLHLRVPLGVLLAVGGGDQHLLGSLEWLFE